MDFTEKISSSNSLNNQMNRELSTSNGGSSQQGVQYPNDNFSLAPSNHWQSNNISTIPTESSSIIDQNGDNIILDIIKKEGLKIMNGRSYDQLTEKEKRDVRDCYANTTFLFIIEYAKTKYPNISDVLFRDFIGHGGVIKLGTFSNKNIKDLNVKDIIQLSGKNHIKTDDSFLKLEFRDFREVYMKKIIYYLNSINF